MKKLANIQKTTESYGDSSISPNKAEQWGKKSIGFFKKINNLFDKNIKMKSTKKKSSKLKKYKEKEQKTKIKKKV